MSRAVTLFTGQWADLPLAELVPLAYEMGYDGLELACWGDHCDVDAAASSKTYVLSIYKPDFLLRWSAPEPIHSRQAAGGTQWLAFTRRGFPTWQPLRTINGD